MMIDIDWIYREFLRRGYTQEYATTFIDSAFARSSAPVEPRFPADTTDTQQFAAKEGQ